MRIVKHFHFYAAHRNQHLNDKCSNLHGHAYRAEARFDCGSPAYASGVTILFDEVEDICRPVIQSFDHALLLDRGDPDARRLLDVQACGKVMMMDKATSLENVALHLFDLLDQACDGTPLRMRLMDIRIAETGSSEIEVSRSDAEEARRSRKAIECGLIAHEGSNR